MLNLVVPPADLSESILQSVLDHLRRYADLASSPQIAPPDLTYIQELTRAAIALIDGPNGKLGRCLLSQTWLLKTSLQPTEVRLPLPPVRSIVSVRYMDTEGVVQTLAPSAYRLFGVGTWAADLAPVYGTSWPAGGDGREDFQITFVSGYGDTMAEVPAPILHAIRLLVAQWYLERQPVTFATPNEMPFGVKEILAQFRLFR